MPAAKNMTKVLGNKSKGTDDPTLRGERQKRLRQ
jgi:hypothetical protein